MKQSTMDFEKLDLGYLELMTEGDTEMQITLIDMLLEEIPEEIGKMQQAVDEKDWPALKAVSHKMKSTLAFVGNPEIIEMNKTIESTAKAGGPYDLVPEWQSHLVRLYPPILEELRAYRSSLA